MYSAYQAVKRGIHEPKYDEVQKQVGAKGNVKRKRKWKPLAAYPSLFAAIVALIVVGYWHSKRQQ